VLADRSDTDVVWICDQDQTRLDIFARRYRTTATSCYSDLINDESLDGIVIATPVFTHYELAAQALEAGKHTFVEKPLASSAAEASALLKLARDNGLSLMCGHTFLYSPPVRAVRAMLERKELGEVYFISSSRVNLGLHQRDVSVIWDLGPHDFSILLYWLGEMPTSVRATGRASIVPGIADVAFVTLIFPSGVVANVELSWLAPSKLRRTVVVGSQQMVVYDDTSAEPLRVYDQGVVYRDPETFGEYHLSYRTGDVVSPKLPSTEPLAAEMHDFVSSLDGRDPQTSQADLAREVVRIIEAADRSLGEGGTEQVLQADRVAINYT